MFSFGQDPIADRKNVNDTHGPLYMSPEQLRNDVVGNRTDIYGFGLILYETFAGVHPFQADTAAEIARLQLKQKPANPSTHRPDMPRLMQRLILACLFKNPARRPSTPRVVRSALAKLYSARG